MYAIVKSGGRQYRAEEGQSFSVEKLPYEVGEQIELSNVLLLADDAEVQIGQPTVPGATVKATVVDQYRGKKFSSGSISRRNDIVAARVTGRAIHDYVWTKSSLVKSIVSDRL